MDPWQNPAETRRTLEETQKPSEKQISSETLGEGLCPSDGDPPELSKGSEKRRTRQRRRLLLRCGRPQPQRTPKGGAKKRGGGKTSRGDPPRKTVSDPPHLGTFCPPPPMAFLLVSPLEVPQNFPQLTSSETAFGGSQKKFPTGHPREVLLFGTFCPPPL